jgi:hypothetical protein
MNLSSAQTMGALVVCVCSVFGVACTSQGTVVKTRAASDLGCPEDKVLVEHLSRENGHSRYQARGCGREVPYQCNGFGNVSTCEIDRARQEEMDKYQRNEEARIASDSECVNGLRAVHFSGSTAGVAQCVSACYSVENACIASTEPMTSERAACLSNYETCGTGCAVDARRGMDTTEPCTRSSSVAAAASGP